MCIAGLHVRQLTSCNSSCICWTCASRTFNWVASARPRSASSRACRKIFHRSLSASSRSIASRWRDASLSRILCGKMIRATYIHRHIHYSTTQTAPPPSKHIAFGKSNKYTHSLSLSTSPSTYAYHLESCNSTKGPTNLSICKYNFSLSLVLHKLGQHWVILLTETLHSRLPACHIGSFLEYNVLSPKYSAMDWQVSRTQFCCHLFY